MDWATAVSQLPCTIGPDACHDIEPPVPNVLPKLPLSALVPLLYTMVMGVVR